MAEPKLPSIIHIDTGMELRGGQRQLLLLARGLREKGWTQLIASPLGSRLEAEARREQFEHLAFPPFVRLRALSMLRRRLRAEAVAVLHAHDGRGQTLAWLASAGLPVRRVAHRRVTFLPRKLAGGRWIHGWKYRHTCDAVIAVSEYVRRILLSCGVPGGMIEVIPDGIDVPGELPAAAARTEIRRTWGCDDGDFVIGTLGASTHEKGLDVVVNAAILLEQPLPSARFIIPADSATRLPRTPSNVRVVKYADKLQDFFPGLDLFVMPSREEGLGSAALLAMSYGLPVVASRAGGLPEAVEDGETGWLVPPGSAPSLANAIAEAERDTSRRSEFGRRGRERAKLFNSGIMLSRVIALYERLLQRPPRQLSF